MIMYAEKTRETRYAKRDCTRGWAKSCPDLGQATAGDSTALKARRRRCDRPQTQEKQGKEGGSGPCGGRGPAKKIELDRQGLPQPSGGRKEYKDDEGKVTKVVEWFGYKLHLLVDVKHEVALIYRVSATKAGDNEMIRRLVEQAKENLPKGRIHTLAYDKAAETARMPTKCFTVAASSR